jgi:ketosteroid isomerase-like protein
MLKRALTVCVAGALICTVPHTAKGQESVEKKVMQLEHDWAEADQKGDAAAMERYEAPDFTFTTPDGAVTGRADDINDLKTGNFKAEAIELNDLKVRVYGKAAVVTGKATLKNCKWHGKDISGDYRFTDVWADTGGKWQVVASQTSALAKQ